MADAEIDVVVIGAGIIGLATALSLQLERRRVVVIDRDPPARGCSQGNAGIVCTSDILPMASLATLIRVPRMLFDPLGPLAIRPRHALRLAPWLARFALSATSVASARAIDALASLNSQAIPAYRLLLDAADARRQLIERGMLKVVARGGSLRELHREIAAMRERGGTPEVLNADEVGELEPALAHRTGGGVFHRDVAHVSDPYSVAMAFAARLQQGGAQLHQAEVRAVLADASGCRIMTTCGELRARQVVVAAGVWSKAFLQSFGLRAPVEAERGYHVSLPQPGFTLTRPIYFQQDSFVATPLSSGLRLAGTAEFAGIAAAPDWRRAEVLLSLARRYLPAAPVAGATYWMGRRPSFPDSLPAIGRVPYVPQVMYAFGHQHLGLTQAAITGACIAALANGRAPPVDLSPFSLERFGRAASRSN